MSGPTDSAAGTAQRPPMRPGSLWVVATPIGNLGDLAPRAVEVLGSAALVCCEDSRRSGRLLAHAGVRAARLAVANKHTEFRLTDDVLGVLGAGGDVAVITDAGTPGVSDPGEHLVRAALGAGFTVSAVPGPVAAVTALVVSGLPTNRFVFEGFLPRSGRERSERIAEVSSETRTVVLYEAPHRIARTLSDLVAACGPDRPVAVCRELTKIYEEVLRGPLGRVAADLGEPRGEYVIVLAARPPRAPEFDDGTLLRALSDAIEAGASKRDAAAEIAREFGVARRRAYTLVNSLGSTATSDLSRARPISPPGP